MKLAALFLIALWPITAFSQVAKPSNGPNAKLIRLHYVDPRDIASLLSGLVTIKADVGLNAVVMRGAPEAVSEAEGMIQQLDVPPRKAAARNVELTVYILGATDKSAAQTAAMPQSLAPVVKQLKAIFPYKSYALLDSMLTRSREGGKASNTGMLRSFPSQPAKPGEPNIYQISYQLSTPETSVSRMIHFHQFHFNGREVVGTSSVDVGFKTSLDLPESKKVVVGKTNIDGGNAALFVVLSAKIE